MKKSAEKKVVTEMKSFINLPTGTVLIGPGTVPISNTSVSRTSIEDLSKALRKASKDKIFETNQAI